MITSNHAHSTIDIGNNNIIIAPTILITASVTIVKIFTKLTLTVSILA